MKIQFNATILYIASAAILFAASAPARAQTTANDAVTKVAVKAPGNQAGSQMIVVSLKDRELALVDNGDVKAIYPVAVGKPSTPSPTGTFTIINHVKDPTYYRPGVVIPPGRWNPVGNRWMGLSALGYGIHGTDVQSSVGKAVSHGCIRLHKNDIEALFARVNVGTRVEIFAQRNAETKALFGMPAGKESVHAPATVLTAKAAHKASGPATVTETAEMTKPGIPAGR
jgi:lipoprotein-anchoring transpeptidase ErfK/SrfK